MIDVLAIIGGSSTVLALGIILYIAIQWVASVRTVGVLRDLNDSQRKATELTERDRDAYKAQNDALTERNKQLQDRLSITESERNQAYEQARDHVVEQLKSANLADAAAFVDRLLAQPLGVRPPVPDAATQAAGNGPGQAAAVQPTKPSGPAR